MIISSVPEVVRGNGRLSCIQSSIAAMMLGRFATELSKNLICQLAVP